jgi:RNA polymerase sigma-70 factor, ECF subfamily
MDEREAEDRELMTRVSTRDGSAFARLFEVHAPLTLGLLDRILGRRGEAEEVLQEVFLQVWMQADRYDGARSTPRGWILMLARSRALDRIRRRDSVRRREEAAGEEASDAVSPVGTERLESLDRKRQVASALGLLSQDQRRCIELAFFEGLTHTQIAERLAAPLGTVKSRILLGMNKLRQALSAQA